MGEPDQKEAEAAGAAPPQDAGPRRGTDGVPGGAAIERMEVDEAGRLVVHLAGGDGPIVDARVTRCFPWSRPQRYVSIVNADGEEIALLETLDELSEENRRVVERQLATKVFNPVIRRVAGHKHEFGITSVTAETDRGTVKFQVRTRDDVRMLSATRALFRDADGNIYELPDITQLDPASRKRLEHYF